MSEAHEWGRGLKLFTIRSWTISWHDFNGMAWLRRMLGWPVCVFLIESHMSDDSELYFLKHEKRPARTELDSNQSPYLLSEWHLPIVWLALFQPQDVRVDAASIRDGDRAYFAALRHEALVTLENRRSWIQAAIPNLELRWLDSFAEFLSTCQLPWVHVQPANFAKDGSAPNVEALRNLLGVFSNNPQSMGAAPNGQQDLYSCHFSKQFDRTDGNIKLLSLGGSGTSEPTDWS